MSLVNMDFATKSVPEKVARARMFVTRLTGNVNFPTPIPPLASITTAVDELETAYDNAQSGDKTSKQIMKEKKEVVDGMISTLGAYLQAESGGDELKIISSGADVRKKNTPIGELPAPVGVLATISTTEGAIDIKWAPVKGAKSYIVQIATDLAGTQWEYLGSSTAARYTTTDLQSGKKYMVRVAALNSSGQSPLSDPALGMAG